MFLHTVILIKYERSDADVRHSDQSYLLCVGLSVTLCTVRLFLRPSQLMIISANLCRKDIYHEASYAKENCKVRQLLKSLLDKSPSSDLCKDNIDDGRAVYTILAERIGNLADDQQYCKQASNAMDKLHYKDEQSMSFFNFVNRLNSNLHLYHLGGEEFTATSKVSILLDKLKVAEGNPIRVTMRNIKCDVRYKSDFNAVVKRIQQDLIGGKTNHKIKSKHGFGL